MSEARATVRGPMSRMAWHGKVAEETMPGIAERLAHQFPVGSQVAVSAVVGNWSHDLTVDVVTETALRKDESSDHHWVSFVTHNYVRGLHGGEAVSFSDDNRGKRFTVNTKNGYGEPIRWIFVAIEEVQP